MEKVTLNQLIATLKMSVRQLMNPNYPILSGCQLSNVVSETALQFFSSSILCILPSKVLPVVSLIARIQ